MASIMVNYAAMASGHDGLVATWGRIEGHLADLDAHVASTADMTADTLLSYWALKARWDASAEQRQAAEGGESEHEIRSRGGWLAL